MKIKEMHRAYKFRLCPNKEQAVLLDKTFGCCRFVYNYFLDFRTKYYTEHKNDKKKALSFAETMHELTLLKKKEEFSWLNEIGSQTIQQSVRHLDSSFTRFFNKTSKYPNFKKKRNGGSCTFPQNFEIKKLTKKYGYVRLPKCKTLFKFRKDRDIVGEILFCTVSKTPTNKYFISFTVKQESTLEKNKLEKAIGIDLGISSFITTSDGFKILKDRASKKKERRRKIYQRKLTKAKKGSKNREKLRQRLAIKFEKEKNYKKDFLHKVSNFLVENQDIIIAEDLNVKGMVKNHKLAKAISHQSFGEFTRQLKYKSDWNNKIFYQVSRWFPSSKICSVCGAQKYKMPLSKRVYECSECNSKLCRDHNAAINIRTLGLSDLNITMAGTAKSYASGKAKISGTINLVPVSFIERRNPFVQG
jgi:putative transposase